MQSSDDGTTPISKPPPKDPDKEFDWEKAYEFADRMQRLAEVGFEIWKEDEHRKRKLKESPNGFPLEGQGCTCHICHHICMEGEMWYNQHGILCITCKDGIDRGEIPASLADEDQEDSWYSVSDLERAFAIKAKVVRKWVKTGVLKAHTITREHRMPIHYFLIEENKDTLPPKRLVRDKFVKEKTKDGKDSFHHEPWYRFVNPVKHLRGYKILEHLSQLTENDFGSQPQLSVTPAIPYLFTPDPL